MSAAESILNASSQNAPVENNDPPSLAKLRRLSAPPNVEGVIAVDLDDVLCQTNHSVARWHNDTYGTNMTINDFYYYYYWKNPYWGDLDTTFKKVKDYYATGRIFTDTVPVPGAREGTQALKDMHFRLVIVTARSPDTADESWQWIDKHFPNIFDSIICTGQFKDVHKTGHEVVTKLSKAQVCADLGAKVLIDDSAENAMQCAHAEIATFQTLLFGDYPWNQHACKPEDSTDDMTFDLRLKRENGREFWKEEKLDLEGTGLIRVKDWSAAVKWIKQEKEEGKL